MSRISQSNRAVILCELKSRSPIFSKLYPNVVSCTITYSRTIDSPGGNISDPHEQFKNVNLSESSFVIVDCFNLDCQTGYFDFRSVIDEMISHHETSRKGEMYCEGYLEEYSANQCLCKLMYNIEIEYI